MGYSYGLSIINTHLSSGSRVVLNNKTVFDRGFWNLVDKYKITSFGGVPQLYELLKQLKFEKINLPYLKYLTQAGGKLEKKNLKYFENICKEKNIKFIIMYGQTEASPRISYLEWKKFTLKFGSIGKVLSGSKFKILDNFLVRISILFHVLSELPSSIIIISKIISLFFNFSLIDFIKIGKEFSSSYEGITIDKSIFFIYLRFVLHPTTTPFTLPLSDQFIHGEFEDFDKLVFSLKSHEPFSSKIVNNALSPISISGQLRPNIFRGLIDTFSSILSKEIFPESSSILE